MGNERRIDFNETKINPANLVFQHFDDGIGFVHRFKQRAVAFVTLTQGGCSRLRSVMSRQNTAVPPSGQA